MSPERTDCKKAATLVRPAIQAREPHELAHSMSVSYSQHAMTPARYPVAMRRNRAAIVQARCGCVKEATFDGRFPYSKGAGFIAWAPRLETRIPTATARFRASAQGEAQVTPGAGTCVAATSNRDRRLIRRALGTVDAGLGQGGDPPVAAKHVRQSLPAVQSAHVRPLVGGAAGVFKRACCCAGMANERPY
jgi:hypothetical protein